MSKLTQKNKLKKKLALLGACANMDDLDNALKIANEKQLAASVVEEIKRKKALLRAREILENPEKWEAVQTLQQKENLMGYFPKAIKKTSDNAMIAPYQPEYDVGHGFDDSILFFVDKIVYLDGWHTYEESGGICVFTIKPEFLLEEEDGWCYLASHGYCVEIGDTNPGFLYNKISYDEALEAIAEQIYEIDTFLYWPDY